MAYEISYYCMSDKGKCRSKNEDNFVCNKMYLEHENDGLEKLLHGKLTVTSEAAFGVFDGLGGEDKGEIASYIAAKNFADYQNSERAGKDLQNVCELVNAQICEYINQNGLYEMGTTAAVLLFDKEEIHLCNVGDTKIFRYNRGELTQCSKDHVYSFRVGGKPLLYQKLGMQEEDVILEPFMTTMSYNSGDIYLIASDGLTDALAIEEIEKVISGNNCETASNQLMARALDASGKDNITFILLKVL